MTRSSTFPRTAPLRSPPSTDGDTDELESVVRRLLELLGEDPDRRGLVDTPRRVAASLRYLTRGYTQAAASVVGNALFEEEHDSLVVVGGIELFSLCEHHLLPFHGHVHVAYVPNGRVVGLSKIARVVEVFARRLQVQERLTDQIADALARELEPAGVGVAVDARHFCMMMRGVEKQSSRTWTRAYRGSLATSASLRDQFLRLAGA